MHGHRSAADRLSDAEPLLFSLLGALKTIDLVMERLDFDPNADAALPNAFFDALANANHKAGALRDVLACEPTAIDSNADSNLIEGDSHAL